jgi:integrase
MAKPRQLPNGTWRIRWFDHEGTRHSEVWDNFKTADRALIAHRKEAQDNRELAKRGLLIPKKEPPLFSDFAKRWIETYPAAAGNRKSTKRDKEMHLRVHIEPAFKSLRLDQIRGEVVDKFFADLSTKDVGKKRKKKLSPKTIRNIRTTLAKMFVTAVEWGELGVAPKLPKVKVPESAFDFLTFEEADKVLAACRNEEERALIMFALRTGCRMGEQRALERGDIDYNASKVIITRSMGEDFEVGPTKSGKGRKITLTPQLAAALKAIEHLRGPLVFCRMDGKPYTKDQLHERIWGACRRAGIRRMTWHSLRHTYASHLAMRNVPLKKIQELLGHATIMMTMKYSHLMPGNDEDVIAALDRWPQSGHGAGDASNDAELQAKKVTPPGSSPIWSWIGWMGSTSRGPSALLRPLNGRPQQKISTWHSRVPDTQSPAGGFSVIPRSASA